MVSRKSRASRASKSGRKKAPIGDLQSREQALKEEIAKLQEYVEQAPERERAAYVEQISTLPPPSEIEDRKRVEAFMDRLSRGEIANERRSQASNGLLLILLLLAIAAIAAWIYRVVQM
ncbi:hypothetical protein HW115_13230 [Verrucomicrobiaceae bacterium N1E253]|uniref:Uncharacterized protein n=1 Tax=Oceaniferula marina TaxID=2748318 RepID=A0A851GFN4_9BACT|nr:hypothetical protein [Oceaniferula marina]NWK56578.1 hypothetical protein [Oceaniferula marina]